MKGITRAASTLFCAVSLVTGMDAQIFHVQKYDIGGEGGTDYLTAEPGTGRIFITRGSHVMVVDARTNRLLGDITDAPGNHSITLVPQYRHGFITNRGDSSLTMFDLTSLSVLKKIKIPVGGLDGSMYDDYSDRVILANHSTPGTATAVDPNAGEITGQVTLEDNLPEGVASDGKGRLYVNNEGVNTIQVIDAKAMKVLDSWSLAPCDGPTGIVYDRVANRIFSGCSGTSAVINPADGKIITTIHNGDGVDALGWDPAEKLLYIPAGRDGNVTIVHQDAPDKYAVVATITTGRGAKTISIDTVTHTAYLFQPVRGTSAAYLYVIRH